MPNSRKRKFSVQNDVSRRAPSKGGTSVSASNSTSNSTTKTNKKITKTYPVSTRAVEPMSIVLECDEYSSNSLVKKNEQETADLSPQPFPNDLHTADTTSISGSVLEARQPTPQLTPHSSKRDAMERNRREKARQHRVRVRSPKHSLLVLEPPKTEISKEENIATSVDIGLEISNEENIATSVDIGLENPSTETIGTNAIDWAQETPVFTVAQEFDFLTEYEPSEHSLDDMCRICHSGDCSCAELGRLVSACACRGTVGRVHVRCLERWLTESGKSRCELCGTRYSTRRVHRYGVPKALIMWFLSQNAQQLMVDGLGIMLMSPLAVLAAWLSGRTLAGLMTQETQVTPWPLASTFVLACMTLVCYYCWIVSAATRHALGWWIWYRSQYEVRLQLQDEE